MHKNVFHLAKPGPFDTRKVAPELPVGPKRGHVGPVPWGAFVLNVRFGFVVAVSRRVFRLRLGCSAGVLGHGIPYGCRRGLGGTAGRS